MAKKYKNKIIPERVGTWVGEDPEYVIILESSHQDSILLGRDANRGNAYREALKELEHHAKVIRKRLEGIEQREYMKVLRERDK